MAVESLFPGVIFRIRSLWSSSALNWWEDMGLNTTDDTAVAPPSFHCRAAFLIAPQAR